MEPTKPNPNSCYWCALGYVFLNPEQQHVYANQFGELRFKDCRNVEKTP